MTIANNTYTFRVNKHKVVVYFDTDIFDSTYEEYDEDHSSGTASWGANPAQVTAEVSIDGVKLDGTLELQMEDFKNGDYFKLSVYSCGHGSREVLDKMEEIIADEIFTSKDITYDEAEKIAQEKLEVFKADMCYKAKKIMIKDLRKEVKKLPEREWTNHIDTKFW